jgi:hypothetical protein
MRSPSVSGGASLDKASNHHNSPESPGGWLPELFPEPGSEGVAQAHSGTQGLREGAPRPPYTEMTFYLSVTAPPDNQPQQLQDEGSVFGTADLQVWPGCPKHAIWLFKVGTIMLQLAGSVMITMAYARM